MQNEKNQTKSLGEEGSEVSAQMGFKINNEKDKTMINRKFGIRKTINTATSKNCPGSYKWFTGEQIAWSRDPAEAKTFPNKEAAKWFLATNHISGRVVEIR